MNRDRNNGHKPYQPYKQPDRRVVMLDSALVDKIDVLADAADLTREDWLWAVVRNRIKAPSLPTR